MSNTTNTNTTALSTVELAGLIEELFEHNHYYISIDGHLHRVNVNDSTARRYAFESKLHEYLELIYCPASGTHHVRNKETGHVYKPCLNTSGYPVVDIGGRPRTLHRIIYTLYTGQLIPEGLFVDHIDGNKLNSEPDNLRVCTRSQNQMNREYRTSNGLPKGITETHEGYYNATIKVAGRVYKKCGKSLETLKEWLKAKRAALHGEFYRD